MRVGHSENKEGMMPDRRDRLIHELEKGLRESIAFFNGLSAPERKTRVYPEGAR